MSSEEWVIPLAVIIGIIGFVVVVMKFINHKIKHG